MDMDLKASKRAEIEQFLLGKLIETTEKFKNNYKKCLTIVVELVMMK